MTYDDTDKFVPSPGMQPDLDEVMQVENVETHLVPVKLCEPVETRELPTKRFSIRTVPLTTAVGVKLLSADPRRKLARIIARTQDILLGESQTKSQLSGSWIPKSTLLPLTSITELWAVSDTGPTDVTVIEEYFA